MIDIRQSTLYARFMDDLGWRVEKIGKQFAYIKQFPLIGSFIKIQRIKPPIPFDKIERLGKKYKAFKVQVAPNTLVISGLTGNPDFRFREDDKTFLGKQFRSNGYGIDTFPNIPTRTILINLKKSEKDIFSCFSEAKRRAVRRAIKNGVLVKLSNDINSFISIRSKHFFPFGFMMKKEMRCLWKNFYPKNADLLLGYDGNNLCLGGILLLHFDNKSYYWYAAANNRGKKTVAPTLLVWEALKFCKKRGSGIFDFEGVYDERFGRATESWRGFTKFKEGFGGEEAVYLPNYLRKFITF